MHSGTVPGTFGSTNVENQGTNEDDSQRDPHPEAGIFRSQTTRNSGPEVDHDMATGVQQEIRYRPHMVTGIQEDVPYCSLGISSGKKKAHSASQPQFRSENTPETIEADQILLALQQLASNSKSANINNNINKVSKLPKSHGNNAHLRCEIRKNWLVWRSNPNEFKNPESAHRRRQNKLLPLSHAWWCTTNIRKHHQPQEREFGRIFVCIL